MIMGTQEIVEVLSSELDSVMILVGDAIQDMEDNGIPQWDEIYPDRSIFGADIRAGELYCVKINGTIAGVMALNEYQSAEYDDIRWSDNGPPLVIHRLCINPTFQGKGLAKLLVRFAEEYAQKHDYSSIRLDAFTVNEKAVGLYDAMNYLRKGIVKFRKGNFYCYKKFFNMQKTQELPV